MQRALLFLNGQPPKQLPKKWEEYALIICTDGAYSSYLAQDIIPIDYIIGDLDSLKLRSKTPHPPTLHTPDQYKTDFEKALLFLISKKIKQVDIYGVSGHATDHFLGNLSVGLHYHKQIDMIFFDDYSHFFFAPPKTQLTHVKDRIISIMPFPEAHGVTLSGFVYPLCNARIKLGALASLRNQAVKDTVDILYKKGVILIFINHST